MSQLRPFTIEGTSYSHAIGIELSAVAKSTKLGSFNLTTFTTSMYSTMDADELTDFEVSSSSLSYYNLQ
jgi:hypothetical protein